MPLLLIAYLTFAAAPPLSDPLPLGAIARLGVARMIAVDRSDLWVSPDGTLIRSAWSHYGEESFHPVKWIRLSDGRDAPPGTAPPGYTFRRVFPDGAYLVGKEGRYLHFASASAREPAVIEVGKAPAYFDVAGKRVVMIEKQERRYTLHQSPLGRPGPVRWQAFATGKDDPWQLRLAAGARHAIWTDGGIRVHDFVTGKTALVPKQDDGDGTLRATISPDGKIIARLTSKGVRLLDPVTGKSLRVEPVAGLHQFCEAEFSAAGKLLVVQTGHKVLHAIPLDLGEKAWEVPVAGVKSFGLVPDGRRVALYGENNVLRVHDLRTGRQLDRHSRYPAFVGVQMLGKDAAASWTAEGRLVTWDARTGRALSEADMPTLPVRFSADGTLAAGYAKGGVVVAETRTGKVVARHAVGKGIAGFDLHPSGKAIWSAESNDEDLTARLLSPSGGKVLLRIVKESGWDASARFSPDGRFLLYAAGTEAWLIEAATGKIRWDAHWRIPQLRESSPPTFEIDFDRRMHRVIVRRTMQNDAVVFDVLTGRRLAVIPVGGNHAVVSGSGRWMAQSQRATTVALWDLHSRHPADPADHVEPPCPEIKALALDEDRARLVTAHADGTCYVWDLDALRAARPAFDEWAALGGGEPRATLEALLRRPARVVRLLSGKLTPVPQVPAARIAGWIAQLDSDDYDERAAAEAGLKAHLIQAEGAMRAAAEKALLEPRLRLNRLLRSLDELHASAAWARQTRAVEVLERIGTPEAAAVLKRLAGGAAGAALTREAAAALSRLGP